jgi:hypothetical protein
LLLQKCRQGLYRERGEFDPRHAAPCRSNPNTRSALSLDQAEACYQLALTEQKLGNIEKTQEILTAPFNFLAKWTPANK